MADFTGATNSIGGEQRRAELYMRIYKYMAEDFVSTKDFATFEAKMYAWMQSIELRLQKLFTIVSNHTHPLIPHVHTIVPHFHTSTAPGNPTSPNIPLGPVANGTRTEISTPYTIAKPNEQAIIKWQIGTVPKFINTTGTIPNLTGNNIAISTKIGIGEDSAPHLRRQTIIPVLLKPSVPEYVQSLT